MRKSLMAATLLAAGVFAVGYAVGQFRGPVISSAASPVATPSTTAPEPNAPPSAGWGNLGPRADGTVTAVNGDTVTVTADGDQGQANEYHNVTTIVLTSSTQYEADHDSGTTASKASIKVGSYIIAEGTLSSDGKSLTASQVSVRPNGPDTRSGSGTSGASTLFGPGDSSAGPTA